MSARKRATKKKKDVVLNKKERKAAEDVERKTDIAVARAKQGKALTSGEEALVLARLGG